jgi:hypothetical protein
VHVNFVAEVEQFSVGTLPLDHVRLGRLTRNLNALTNLIDPDNGFVAELYAANCINVRQKCEIESILSTPKKNQKLLDVLMRRSIRDYELFVHCLFVTGQDRVASILSKDGGEFYSIRL